jgi:PAS domain S-box-containing protein
MKENPIGNFSRIDSQSLLKVGYWRWNIKTNEIDFSENMQSLLGLDCNEKVQFAEFLNVISLYDRVRVQNEISKLVVLPKSFNIVFRYFKQGYLEYFSLVGDPKFDDHKNLIYFEGIGQVITENKNSLFSIQSNSNLLKRTQRIAKIGNWIWDNENKIVNCDEEMHAMFGVSPIDSELSFRTLRGFFSPVEWKKCLLFIRKNISLKKNGWFEQKIFSADGKQKQISVFFELEFNEDKTVKAIYGIVQDVSDQKLVQEQLRYRIEFERMVGAVSSNFINLKSNRIDAGIKIALDIIGNFMNVNRSYLFLFSENNSIAKLCYQWHGDFVKNFGIDNEVYRVEDFPLLFGTILRGETLFLEDVNRIKKSFATEKELLLQIGAQSVIWVPLSLEGKVIGGLGFDSVKLSKTWTDDEITLLRICGEVFVNAISRKKYEIEMKQNEEHVSVILESITDAVIAIDDKNKIMKVNSAAANLTNYHKDILIGMKVEEILKYSGIELEGMSFNSILNNLKKQVGNKWDLWKISTKDRRLLPIALNCAPLKDSSVGVIGTVIVCRELTDQIKLEEQLRHSEKMRMIGQLSGGIAHDFNNLLTGIIGCANYLKKHLKGNTNLLEFVENILITGRRAANLTSQLLAFSRHEKPRLTEIDANFLVNDVCNLLSHTIDPIVQIKKEFNSPFTVLEGDESQLHNAILNLAINSRDAMPKGGVIQISTSYHELKATDCVNELSTLKPNRYIAFSVKDNGHGIPMEMINHIFEPFFTTKEKGKGTGLGLAAVYGTVLAHHGCITVKSELGVFTEFMIYLPLLDRNFIESPKIDKPSPQIVNHKNILVVDDEVLLCSLVCELLSDAGYTTKGVFNGLDALDIYKKEYKNIDLVLIDMLMPTMNGPELIEKMNLINPNLKAIVISGFTGNLDLNQIIKEKKIPFLQKPYEEKNLIKLIEQVLAR